VALRGAEGKKIVQHVTTLPGEKVRRKRRR